MSALYNAFAIIGGVALLVVLLLYLSIGNYRKRRG
jgi:hypothetical protein